MTSRHLKVPFGEKGERTAVFTSLGFSAGGTFTWDHGIRWAAGTSEDTSFKVCVKKIGPPTHLQLVFRHYLNYLFSDTIINNVS